LRVARARTRIATGHAEAGVSELLALGNAIGSAQFSSAMCPWHARAAVGLSALGRRDEARAYALQELSLARRTASRWGEVVALQALATAAPDEAVDHLEVARDLAESGGFALEQARSLVLLGAVHRRAGRRTVATEILRRGLDLSARCGAGALEMRALSELTATGARPRRRRQLGADALTPGERRVAELATNGMTNREIAQSLFVSLRTVETHLTHCYRKLAITSRGELADALSQSAPDAMTPARPRSG
jgi:DNA-binding NarL/FixJ family response regulator